MGELRQAPGAIAALTLYGAENFRTYAGSAYFLTECHETWAGPSAPGRGLEIAMVDGVWAWIFYPARVADRARCVTIQREPAGSQVFRSVGSAHRA